MLPYEQRGVITVKILCNTTYASQKQTTFKANAENAIQHQERPKNSQLKVLGTTLLNSLVCFGLLASINSAAKMPNALKDAAFVSTLFGLSDTCFNDSDKHKLKTDEKLGTLSIITILGLAATKYLKEQNPTVVIDGIKKQPFNHLKTLAYASLAVITLFGLYENAKNSIKRNNSVR